MSDLKVFSAQTPRTTKNSNTSIGSLPTDLDVRHFQHFKDDRNRPADQQEPVERGDWSDQTEALRSHRVAVAERGVVLEREFERSSLFGFDTGQGIARGPHRNFDEMRQHQYKHRN